MIPALLRRAAVRVAVRPAPAGHADRAVRVVTAALVAAAVGFVLRFGSNVPVADEWDLIQPVLRDGVRVGWLFEHHNEHRYPLAKLVWAGLLVATGFDFRAGPVASAGALAAGAVVMLAAARRLRGRPHVADLILPALLLHWGHWFNLLRGDQLAVTLVALCGAGVLLWAARAEPGREVRVGLGAGAVLLLLVPAGGFGLGYAGPVAAWVGYLGWRRWAAGGPGRWWQAAGVLGPAATAVGYAAVVWLTTPPPLIAAGRPRLPVAVGAFVEYLATGLGRWATDPGPGQVAGMVVVAAAYGLAVLGAGRAVLTDPAERPRAIGLLAVLAGHFLVTAAIAWYRGPDGGDRFVTPSTLGLCACWLAVVRYGPRVPAAAGAAAAVAVYALNLAPGHDHGINQRAVVKAVLADVRAGRPPLAVSGKYGGHWVVNDPNGTYIDGLRAAGIGPFAGMAPNPPVRAVPVAVPAALPACDQAAFAAGNRPAVRVPDPPGPVLGLRVRVRQHHVIAWQELELTWAGGYARAYPPGGRRDQDVVFWVGGGTPRDVRLVPACPTYGFDLLAAEWLLPGP